MERGRPGTSGQKSHSRLLFIPAQITAQISPYAFPFSPQYYRQTAHRKRNPQRQLKDNHAKFTEKWFILEAAKPFQPAASPWGEVLSYTASTNPVHLQQQKHPRAPTEVLLWRDYSTCNCTHIQLSLLDDGKGQTTCQLVFQAVCNWPLPRLKRDFMLSTTSSPSCKDKRNDEGRYLAC